MKRKINKMLEAMYGKKRVWVEKINHMKFDELNKIIFFNLTSTDGMDSLGTYFTLTKNGNVDDGASFGKVPKSYYEYFKGKAK